MKGDGADLAQRLARHLGEPVPYGRPIAVASRTYDLVAVVEEWLIDRADAWPDRPLIATALTGAATSIGTELAEARSHAHATRRRAARQRATDARRGRQTVNLPDHTDPPPNGAYAPATPPQAGAQ